MMWEFLKESMTGSEIVPLGKECHTLGEQNRTFFPVRHLERYQYTRYQKTCVSCGKIFTSHRDHAKCCSPKCRKRESRKDRNE